MVMDSDCYHSTITANPLLCTSLFIQILIPYLIFLCIYQVQWDRTDLKQGRSVKADLMEEIKWLVEL